MAKQNRTILKTYFQQGDIPTQGQYTDLIDSNLNLNDGNTQTLSGSISASSFISSAGITLAGDVSSSGNLIIGSITASSGASIAGKLTAASAIITNITGSNISASLQIITDKIVTGSASNGFTLVGDITSSGVISASGGFIGNATSATSASIITGLTTTVTELNYLGGLTSGEATQIKNIGTSSISATEWGYVATMQDVATSASPSLTALMLTGKDEGTATYDWDANISLNSQCFSIITTTPAVPGNIDTDEGNTSTSQTVSNDAVKHTSVIIASCSVGLQVVCHTVRAGIFAFYVVNNTKTPVNAASSTIISFVVL